MNTEEKIRLQEIDAGAKVFVKGKVSYSRIGSYIEGEELDKYNENRMFKKQQPFYTMTIKEISNINSQSSLLGKYIAQRTYTSKKYPNNGKCYTIDGIGNLPEIMKLNENGSYSKVNNENGLEIQSDTEVTLVLRVYKSKNYSNKGLGFNGILIENTKDIKDCLFNPRTNSGLAKTLMDMGLTVESDDEIKISKDEVKTEDIQFPEQEDDYQNESMNVENNDERFEEALNQNNNVNENSNNQNTQGSEDQGGINWAEHM